MATKNQSENKSLVKGNSEDSLLVIYILSILKKYSSPKNPLSSQEVMHYLREDYSIGDLSKVDAQRKKVRRLLDTLHESYDGSCIKKVDGKTTREGHKWFYDVSRDKFADENVEVVTQETLTETEINLLVDLVLATKIFNSEGTRGLVDKLLRKTSISGEDRARRLSAIQREDWFKNSNEDLAEKKDLIEGCFYCSNLIFDYEDEEAITATPLGWSNDDGICYLNAKVGNEYRKFSLDKIRISDTDADGYEDFEDFRLYDEETDSDKTSLDSLFVNIPTIKSAIADKKCLHFLYRSYRVANDRVVSADEEKSVFPHSLVFNDGKYYLIGIDEDVPELNKIAYFRVDLMFELYCAEMKFGLSNWDKHVFETTERARVVEKHPLMLVGREVPITFKVAESALDRVIDAFAVTSDKFTVSKETRMVKDSSAEDFHEERVVNVQVKTTAEEAFRWALANADVVELVYPQEIRDRLGRIADPIYQLYTQTLSDKVRENIDYVLKEGVFKISNKVDPDTAYATYKELVKMGSLGIVNDLYIIGDKVYDGVDYFGDFINANSLTIKAPNLKNASWASKLVNVTSLTIEDSEIEDLSWMKEMKKLKYIWMDNSSFSDLSVLSEHEHIDMLNINGTNVSDISFIENFKNLKQLFIATCPIEDYSPLFTTCAKLKYLEIDKRSLEEIGEEKIRSRHIGIEIKPTSSVFFWL